MTLKNDEKSEKFCRFKVDIRNLANFDSSTWVSKIYSLMGCFWPKYIMFELKKYGGVSLIVLNIDAKFEEKLTYAFKTDIRNLANFYKSTFESIKIGTLMGSF